MNIINFSKPVTGNFLVDIIVWLVSISSSIAVGIVLFTVILKLITLPFDFFSRASMRKNSLKMEEMRPELEKLQQQYANDKALYNQKMMALYKKNGYSMFGACLPTILTLVIFIIALNAFTSFSQFQNRQYFYNMSKAYNNVIYAGLDIDTTETGYITRDAEGKLVTLDQPLLDKLDAGESEITVTIDEQNSFKIFLEKGVQKDTAGNDTTNHYLQITTTNGYIQLRRIYEIKDGAPAFTSISEYTLLQDKLVNSPLASAENNNLKIKVEGSEDLDYTSAKAYYENLNAGVENYQFTPQAFMLDIQQQKAADKYREEQASFLWVKNIWVTDSPLSHPVVDKWATFKQTHAYPNAGADLGDEGYNSLTAKLSAEKSAPNGYFILVILTAGTSLLMQLVMSKSQKAQMELQTVDGQGKQTQKMMTVIMPIMMAFFAFMYTSAFSIYIILSSVISIGTTFGINKIVDIKFKKEKDKKKSDGKIRGRIYTPKEKPQTTEQKPKKKKKDNANQNPNDFLSGTADGKKHVRGRLK